MKKFLVNSFVINFFTFVFLGAINTPWTFLVYIAADNSLADFAQFNINQMKMVNNPNVTILAYWCPPAKNGKKIAQKIVITSGAQKVIGIDPDIDSGKKSTLLGACNWAITEYPSDKFALILWNHGSGILNRSDFSMTLPRGFCYDDTTGSYLTDLDLRSVLSSINAVRKKKVDIVGFDACLMAGIEIGSAVADYASYLVASEQTELGYGWNYRFLQSWKGGQDQAAAVGSIVEAYDSFYTQNNLGQKTNDYTLSACNLEAYSLLEVEVNNLSSVLLNGLKSSLKNQLKFAIQKSIIRPFDELTYIDLFDFAHKLSNNIVSLASLKEGKIFVDALTNALSRLRIALKSYVVKNVQGELLKNTAGVSIYFPRGFIEPSYSSCHFAQSGAWTSFIANYLNS